MEANTCFAGTLQQTATMNHTLHWTGILYPSQEDCVITTTAEGTTVQGIIAGRDEGQSFEVQYHIRINAVWAATSFEIKSQVGERALTLVYESDGNGHWWSDGEPVPQLDGCIDIDISVTPFTNTLPINRLQWEQNMPQLIRVVYINILDGTVRPLQQRYTQLSPKEYRYENMPSGFEAVISVDDDGLVVHYPGLFKREDES